MNNKTYHISLNFFFIALWFLFPNNSLQLLVNDVYYSFNQNTPNENVVFLNVDEKSINKFGRWPWKRGIIARELSKLNEAKIVVLDMVFSEKTESDEQLSESINSLQNSVCGFFLRSQATQTIDMESFDTLLDSSIELEGDFLKSNYAESNVEPILSACTLNGIFSTLHDGDNNYRHYPIAMMYQKAIFPSIGIQALRLYYNRDIKLKKGFLLIDDHFYPLNKNNFLKLNFYKRQSYHSVSVTDINNYSFKDKIVIVGVSEAGISDLRTTPIGQIPGPFIHYTFLSNILNSDHMRTNLGIDFLLIVIMLFFPHLIARFFDNLVFRLIFNFTFMALFILIAIQVYTETNFAIDLFSSVLIFILNILIIEGFLLYYKEKEAKFITEAFRSYLSAELLEELSNSPEKLKLGGEQKELTILFSDIRGFTSISENLKPTEVVTLINDIFTPLSHIITDHRGMVDKYIGDAIMALYNAPIDVENHPTQACLSALLMQKELTKINAYLHSKGLSEVRMGIGINTDLVAVGNMGSDIKFNYSALGDGVNVASRLESETKPLKKKILISKSTYEKIDQDYFICEAIGALEVKGKKKVVEVYSLIESKDITL